MNSAAYRDDQTPLRLRLESLRAQHRDDLAHVPTDLRDLHARRFARIVAGKAAVLGAAAALALTLYEGLLQQQNLPSAGAASRMLLASWLLVALAYAIARPIGGHLHRRALTADLPPTHDAHADLARLEAHAPKRLAWTLVIDEERASVAWPLMGIAALAPISLHFVVYALFRSVVGDVGTKGFFVAFDGWMIICAVLTTHCHLVLIHGARRFARMAGELSITEFEQLDRAGQRAFGHTLLSSALPGAIASLGVGLAYGGAIMLVEVLLVAVTAFLIVLPMFGWMRVRLIEERLAIAKASDHAVLA